jgi:hypothetical protein
LADTTRRITLTSFPQPRTPKDPEEGGNAKSNGAEQEEEDEDEDEDQDLKVQAQFQVKPARKSDSWVGLEVMSR